MTGDRWEEYFQLLADAEQPGWWRAYGVDDKGYVPLEADALLVRDYTLAYVPGLLQTADYARALFVGAEDRSAEKLRTSITVRMIRQKRLTSKEEPLRLDTVMSEATLQHPVGGPKVMVDQLERLVERAALDTVTLRVLPLALGAHVGMSTVFTLLSFGERDEPDVVYTENLLGSTLTEFAARSAEGRIWLVVNSGFRDSVDQ